MIFQEILFHKMEEKHNEYKASKPRLLIIFVGCIVCQELLDISLD